MNLAVCFLLFLTGVGSSLSWQYFYVSQNMSWSDAQTYCRTNYIDLVTVRNLSDVNTVIALAASSDPAYTGPVWLGLRRTWTWATGELYTGQVPFMSGQPNEGNDGAACAVITSYGMEDWFCSTSHYFLCYDDSPTAASKFVLIRLVSNWTVARDYCRKHYADLATFQTPTELNTAVSLTAGNAFAGLISAQWSDYSFSPFRYWAKISGLETSLSNKCTAMVVSNSGKWSSFNCALQMPFVCYGDLREKKRQILRVKLSSDGITESVQTAILYKIEEKLKAYGITPYVRLSWRITTDGSVFMKVRSQDSGPGFPCHSS